MLMVGLTGSYGAGKSTALSEFKRLGAHAVSADEIVADLLKDERVLGRIRGIFGPRVFGPGGGLLKDKVAEAIFKDEGLRRALEGLLHPMVFRRVEDSMPRAGGIAVVEVPLLYEGGYEGRFKRVIVVRAALGAVKGRLKKKGISEEEARLRRDSQMPEEQKAKRADFVIDNSGPLAALREQVKRIYGRLLKEAGSDAIRRDTKGRMRIINGFGEVRESDRGAVLTIGNFDGVHLGHQKIVQAVLQEARAEGARAMALTFEPHPVRVLAPERDLKMLTPADEKARLLGRYGVDTVLFARFTREFASQAPEDFIRDVLVERLGVRAVVVGHNYTFGKGKRGNTALLRRRGVKYGFSVKVVRNAIRGGEAVSSSRVRDLVARGRVAAAAGLLGRAYSMHGTVIRGAGRGEAELHTPTANISTPAELAPKRGVYAVMAGLEGGIYEGVANIGENPTFKGTDKGAAEGSRMSYEVHLLDFRADLRGKDLRIFFIRRLRDERKFDGPGPLLKQIKKDIAKAREILGKGPAITLI